LRKPTKSSEKMKIDIGFTISFYLYLNCCHTFFLTFSL
jgi:hypothetical protein